jgi:hypothetical protein
MKKWLSYDIVVRRALPGFQNSISVYRKEKRTRHICVPFKWTGIRLSKFKLMLIQQEQNQDFDYYSKPVPKC